MTLSNDGGTTEPRVQLGHIDDVPESLLDPALPGVGLSELLAYADANNSLRASAAAALPESGWRIIRNSSGFSQSENQAWVAPAADGSWHQLNLVTLRRDGSKRVQPAPFQLRVYPCRSDRRKPLRLEWMNRTPVVPTGALQKHQFQLKLTNTGSTTWLNVAQDKSTLDLFYTERTPGFTQLFIGEDLPDIPPSHSVIVEGRLAETPPVGTYTLTGDLVDLQLRTVVAATLTVTE